MVAPLTENEVRYQNAALDHENELLRAALIQIRVTCDGNAEPSCDKGMALAFVRDVAAHALNGQCTMEPK